MTKLLIVIAAFAGVTTADYVPRLRDYEVEQAARDYRIQVYNTFRLDRAEYERRQEIGRSLLRAWREAGNRSTDREQLLQWFGDATDTSARRSVRLLPRLPEFVDPTTVDTNHKAATATRSLTDPRVAPPARQHASSLPDSAIAESMHIELPAEAAESHGTPGTSTGGVASSSDRPGIVQGVGRALLRAASLKAATDEPAGSEPTQKNLSDSIDIGDLKARILGYNSALSSVRTAIADEEPLSAEQLQSLVDELEDLTQRHGDLEPYINLAGLSEIERRYVGELLSPYDVIGALKQRIADFRSSAPPEVPAKDATSQSTQEVQLDQLLERLTQIVNSR